MMKLTHSNVECVRQRTTNDLSNFYPSGERLVRGDCQHDTVTNILLGMADGNVGRHAGACPGGVQ